MIRYGRYDLLSIDDSRTAAKEIYGDEWDRMVLLDRPTSYAVLNSEGSIFLAHTLMGSDAGVGTVEFSGENLPEGRRAVEVIDALENLNERRANGDTPSDDESASAIIAALSFVSDMMGDD